MMDQLKTKSISLNIFLYNLRTILDILLPLVTFPYITRVLGPDSLGKIGYAESIIGYFILFSQLGIPAYAPREIARVRDSLHERSRVFWELTYVLFITTFLLSIIYLSLICNFNKFKTEIILYLLVFPNLLLRNLNSEWFYQGIEDQTYITIRLIIIRILQCCAIFLLIKKQTQYILYAAITVGLTSISTIMNLLHLKKYIVHVKFSSLNINRHLKVILVMFASVFSLQINRMLDITMIGSMIDESSISYYTVANRIVMIANSLILGISITMTPRIENIFAKQDMENYRKYLNISLYFALMLAIPMMTSIIMLAPSIVNIIAGKQYNTSILSMQLLSPIIVIVNISNTVVSLILYPNRQELKYTIAIFIGSMANMLFNFLMIPKIGINGAILGTVISESIVLVLSIYFTIPYLKQGIINNCFTEILKYILSAFIISIIIIISKCFINNDIILLITDVFICIPLYSLSLFILKSKYFLEVKNIIFSNIKKGNNCGK